MKLNPPASSSDLDVARQIARRLHQRRRREDQPGRTPDEAQARSRLTPPPLPPRPGAAEPLEPRLSLDAPPQRAEARPPHRAEAAQPRPSPPAPPERPLAARPSFELPNEDLGALSGDDLPRVHRDEPAPPEPSIEARTSQPAPAPEAFEPGPFDEALPPAPPAFDVDVDEPALGAEDALPDDGADEPPLSPEEMVGEPETEDSPLDALAEPAASPFEEELLDAPAVVEEPVPPSWDEIADSCRELAQASAAMLVDPAGQVFAARGDWPAPGPEAIAGKLVAMMAKTLKDAPTRSISAPLMGMHLTAWRVPLQEGLVTAAFIGPAPVKADARPAIDGEIHKGAGA